MMGTDPRTLVPAGTAPRATALCETGHAIALAAWFGALMTGAVSAAIMFPAMRELDPHLPAYQAYTDPHWKLAAGHVQASIFLVSDMVQLGAASMAFLTLGLRLIGAGVARAPRRAATAVRTVAVAAGVLLVSTNLLVLSPKMTPPLRAYWELAQAGRLDEARAAAAEFASYHPTASRLHGATAVAVLVALTAGAWSLARRIET